MKKKKKLDVLNIVGGKDEKKKKERLPLIYIETCFSYVRYIMLESLRTGNFEDGFGEIANIAGSHAGN